MKPHVLAGLAVAGFLGLLLLPYPFAGDQALFVVSADMLRRGAVLYSDVWDVKQPGLFLFFLAGGRLFGFDETGIHLFELIYLLGGVAVITWLIRRRYRTAVALGSVPILTVGAYYASVATPTVMSQLEWLVGIPLFLSLWCTVSAVRRPRAYVWLVAGLLGGGVVLFKSLLVLVVAAVWLAVLAAGLRNGQMKPRGFVRAMGWLALGGVVAWLPFAAEVIRHDLWDEVVFTFVTFPPQAMKLYPRQVARLLRSSVRFVVIFSPLLLLAGARLRSDAREGEGGDLLTLGLIAWIVSGLVVVLLQLWWPYHFYLLLFPLGILASAGLDRIVSDPRPGRAIVLSVAVLCMPMLYLTGLHAVSLVRHGFALRPSDRLAYQSENFRYGDLTAIVDEVGFLKDPATAEGTLWVLGDPVYQYRSGRDPASPVFGWSAEMWTPRIWHRTLLDLQAAPPPYLFIQDAYVEHLESRGAELAGWLASAYRPLKQGSAGTWYQRLDR